MYDEAITKRILPLEGIKVLDLGWWAVWPLAAKYLGDYGAQVVRIEYASRLAERVFGPYKDGVSGPERCGYFLELNTSKYGMTLNIRKPKGLEVAKRLVAWADIVGEGFTPGVVKTWGLDYESCREINPDIIYVSSSGLGQNGPDAQAPMYGHVVQAISGINQLVGWPDRAPVGPNGPWTDYYVPYLVITTLLAALDRRRRIGRGVYIDAAAGEASLYGCFEANILDYLVNGREATRIGNSHPQAAPHGTYRCRGEDKWCSVAVFTEQEWLGFCKVIGEPQWTKDSKFTSLMGRKQNEDELNALIERWTSGLNAEEVMLRLQAEGVPAGVVLSAKDLFDDPQLQHRGHFWTLDHKELGPTAFRGSAFKLSKSPPAPRATHLLGEHNEYVLRTFLNMTDEQISEIAAAGSFE